MRLSIKLITAIMSEAITAVRRLVTENPVTKNAVAYNKMPLITNKKSPSVSIEIGSVKMTSMGRIRALRSPSTTAAIISAGRPENTIPGSR
jgi:hypothetical protein